MTTIRVNRMHYPVDVLGFGRRLGVWLQGCSVGCAGCVSHDTWDPNGAPESDIAEVVERARSLVTGDLDGITISGGEPFDQPEALTVLLQELRTWTSATSGSVDILCYTGRPFNTVSRLAPQAVGLLDAIIPEPYRPAMGPGGAWRGSANQPLIALTSLGTERYAGTNSSSEHSLPGLQLAVEADGGVWIVGVPRRGDLPIIEDRLRQAGIVLEGVSWRP